MQCSRWPVLGSFIFALLLGAPPAHPQGIITTVAGTTWVFRGDGGPATSAPLGAMWGVAVDAAGNVYASDQDNNLVVRISPSGILTVVAGNGVQGFSGDGGPATSASLSWPSGAAVDAAGNLYIADCDNNRIRKVSPSGIISTVAGNGEWGFSGDGGPATSASLEHPNGVAVDAAGDLYIADGEKNRIRKVNPSGIISTMAGNGTWGFSGDGGPATSASLKHPNGVAVDAAGNLYIADGKDNRIRKVNPSGIISTIAGNGTQGFSGDGGSATSASLNQPYSVAVDAAGNLYIVDTNNNRIRKVSPSGIISTVAGNGTQGFAGDGGPATSASLNFPSGVAVDAAGNLYIVDTNNNRIRKVNPSGTISTVAGNGAYKFAGDGGPATSASLSPSGVAVDAAGNLYIADESNHRIRKVNPSRIISTVAGNGVAGFSGDGGPATSASFFGPSGVAVDAAGNLYIADYGNNRIRQVSPSGIISTAAGNGTKGFSGDGGPATSASLDGPWGVAVDTAGNVYVAGGYRIRRISSAGIISTVADFSDRGPAPTVYTPAAIAVDAVGNLCVALTDNRLGVSIRQVSPSGTASTIYIGTSPGLSPSGLAVDTPGNLYIADNANQCIHEVSPSRIVSTIAGNGTKGFSGDGGPATSASLNRPMGVVLDAAGNLYIADSGNDRIRKVSFAPSATANPIPSITSLSPSSATAVGPALTLTVNGSNFVQGSVVRWNGADRPTTLVSATQLTAAIPASDLASAGTAQITVFNPAPGGGASGALAFAITGTVLAAFEPQLTRLLPPGFYILEATLAPGAAPGFWGLEVLTSRGQAAGGFNLGGALDASGVRPAFGAFLLTAPQTVKATVNAQMPAGSTLTMRFLDAQRKQIGEPVTGPAPLSLSYSFAPGFYIVEVYNSASVPVTYQLGLAADFFAGGVDTGGYLAAGITGFGAFYVSEAQDVTMKLFGQNTYGAGGAGSMILTLKDANRQVLQVVGP